MVPTSPLPRSCLTRFATSQQLPREIKWAAKTTKPSITMKKTFLLSIITASCFAGLAANAADDAASVTTQNKPVAGQEQMTNSAAQLTQAGWQLWQARKLDDAAGKFQQATLLAPDNAEAWNGLGWAKFNSGHA